MTTPSDDALQTLHREVQRLLGRCLLRLQQYERLIKAIVAHHDLSGPPHALEANRAARVTETARKTLGTLVGDLLGSYVVASESSTSPKAMSYSAKDTASVSFRMHLSLSEADFARTENELRELVLLRNSLIHHFIDQHDLWSLEGCHDARDALVAAYSRIDQHFEQLRGWAEHMEQCRRLAETFVRSDEFRDLVVNGIAPDGMVHWPAAGIVSALRKAADELAVDGWASITEAGKWIVERFPEQLPAKYGCGSWRQVVHESRAFEIRYLDMNGQRAARYREKEKPATSR
jgi:hypothetical protein